MGAVNLRRCSQSTAWRHQAGMSGRAEKCLEGIYLTSGLVWMKPRDEFYPELVQSLVVLGNVIGCREAARPGSLAT